ncbi:hypothetical protein FE257_004729 [Aspergillus nanangensis]|uniref:glucan endo-1,3-beta-D-glucosidase n=1 Tax=Aspergillus nanangensis TaxID=2582783 RepID=A0AAD4CR46_ASPNN|nr:hypothetical protein FE257_004729 [Aspergillus nanangensis]
MSSDPRSFSFNHGDDNPVDDPRRQISPLHEYPSANTAPYDNISPISGHGPGDRGLAAVPEHGDRNWGLAHTQSMRTQSTTTPGMDNMGPSAVGGGISGIALGVANTNDRQSGVDAFRDTDGRGQTQHFPAERGYHTSGSDNPYIPAPPLAAPYESAETLRPRESYGSGAALAAAAASPAGHLTPGASNPSRRSLIDSPYQGVGALDAGPYQRQSVYNNGDYPLVINPDEIIDDGDDGFVLPSSKAAGHRAQAVPAAGAGAAAGGMLGGFFGGKKAAAAGPSYGPVPGAGIEAAEKGQWAKPKPGGGSRKRGWIVGIVLAFVIVGAIVGGAVGGILGNRENDKEGPSSSTETADGDNAKNGDLDKDSSEIKALMGNTDLHKVFPGVDYTPWGTQYPLCEKWPPSQNNVTRDMAVLSQLTNTVRLYGTDCNQTEMVLHAIDRLELKDMKLWLGVWIDTNDTTNARQVKQLYNILDNADDLSIFKGAIVGNEALYRAGSDKQSAQTKLVGYMDDVRDHFKQHNIDLPIATSDLGDNWNEALAAKSDAVMSNVHPFFAGVEVDVAASWTWSFWNNHNLPLTQGTKKKQIISEVGWPSGGGNDCGQGANCPNDSAGSVAGIDEMNQFMSDWICQALDNGTDYFWFEAFDEPWKVQYNTKDEQWEDKWGLMDAARNLKKGLKIPDCGGKTAS